MKKVILPKDYPHYDFSLLKIILLEGSAHTLNNMSDSSKSASMKYLKELGVTVVTEVFVTGYDGETVKLSNGEIIKSRNLALNLRALENRKPLKEYEYNDMGSMATIGKHRAVVDLLFWRFRGYFAWFVWMFLHLMLILSVKNKLMIFINWAWYYLTRDSSLRLIFNPVKKEEADSI